MRIAGITIPENKQIRYGLTEVYGVGLSRATHIATTAQVEPTMLVKELTPDQESKLRTLVEEYTIEGELRRKTSQDIKRLKDIESFRGMRHARNLPARGQRTKTNSRTVRGNVRKTMGSGRIKVEKT